MIAQFITDLFLVTFLGLFIAFSPMLIVVNLLIVLKSKKPILHAIALILGILSPLLIVAGLGLWLIQPSSEISLKAISTQIQIPPMIDILFGITLLIVAIKRAMRPPVTIKPTDFHIPNDRFWTLYAFGFMKSLLSATNLFAVLVVVKLIIESSFNPLLDVIILAWTLGVGMIPFVVVLYYHRIRRDYLIQLNERLNLIMARNLRRLIIICLFSLGTLFTLMGFWEYFS